MKFGKLAARRDARTLRFDALLAPQLPPAPVSFDVLPRTERATGVKDVSRLYPLDGNGRYGDCVMAGIAHQLTIWNAMDGHKRVPSGRAVVDAYFNLTGGNDAGLVMLDTLNVWRKDGLLKEKILAYVSLGRDRPDHVKSAVSLFGCAFVGFAVQDNTMSEFRHRRPWTPGAPTGQGHAVVITGYDAEGVTVLTWGATQRASWLWVSICCDELYAVLPGEATLKGFAPGLDLDALKSDLAQVSA